MAELLSSCVENDESPETWALFGTSFRFLGNRMGGRRLGRGFARRGSGVIRRRPPLDGAAPPRRTPIHPGPQASVVAPGLLRRPWIRPVLSSVSRRHGMAETSSVGGIPWNFHERRSNARARLLVGAAAGAVCDSGGAI